MTWDIGSVEQIANPVPPTLTCPKGQFLAEYFNNIDLSGTPAFSRCETSINYNWAENGPGNGIAVDNFSVRWSGIFTFADGDFLFTAIVDDGVRIWVDGVLVIDAWMDQSVATYQKKIHLTAGDHAVKIEFYEHGSEAICQCGWQLASSTPTPEPIPPPAPTIIEILSGGVVQVSGPIDKPLSYKSKRKNEPITVIVK